MTDIKPEITLLDLSAKMEEVVAVVNRIETDLSYDRSRIDDIIQRLSAVEAQQKTLIDRVPRVETRMKDAVSDAVMTVVQPMTEQLDSLIAKAKDKKLVIKQEHKPGFWARLFHKKSKEVKK